MSDAISASDAAALEKLFKRAGGDDVFVVGLASLKGEEGARALGRARFDGARGGVTTDVGAILPAHVAGICDAAITKPLKGNALEDILDTLAARGSSKAAADDAPPPDAVHKGLTKNALCRQIHASLRAGQRGQTLPDPAATRKGRRRTPLAAPITRKVAFPPPRADVTIESLISTQDVG